MRARLVYRPRSDIKRDKFACEGCIISVRTESEAEMHVLQGLGVPAAVYNPLHVGKASHDEITGWLDFASPADVANVYHAGEKTVDPKTRALRSQVDPIRNAKHRYNSDLDVTRKNLAQQYGIKTIEDLQASLPKE